MIQEILTYIFIAAAFGYMLYGFYKTFLVKSKKSICSGCSGECHLKLKSNNITNY